MLQASSSGTLMQNHAALSSCSAATSTASTSASFTSAPTAVASPSSALSHKRASRVPELDHYQSALGTLAALASRGFITSQSLQALSGLELQSILKACDERWDRSKTEAIKRVAALRSQPNHIWPALDDPQIQARFQVKPPTKVARVTNTLTANQVMHSNSLASPLTGVVPRSIQSLSVCEAQLVPFACAQLANGTAAWADLIYLQASPLAYAAVGAIHRLVRLRDLTAEQLAQLPTIKDVDVEPTRALLQRVRDTLHSAAIVSQCWSMAPLYLVFAVLVQDYFRLCNQDVEQALTQAVAALQPTPDTTTATGPTLVKCRLLIRLSSLRRLKNGRIRETAQRSQSQRAATDDAQHALQLLEQLSLSELPTVSSLHSSSSVLYWAARRVAAPPDEWRSAWQSEMQAAMDAFTALGDAAHASWARMELIHMLLRAKKFNKAEAMIQQQQSLMAPHWASRCEYIQWLRCNYTLHRERIFEHGDLKLTNPEKAKRLLDCAEAAVADARAAQLQADTKTSSAAAAAASVLVPSLGSSLGSCTCGGKCGWWIGDAEMLIARQREKLDPQPPMLPSPTPMLSDSASYSGASSPFHSSSANSASSSLHDLSPFPSHVSPLPPLEGAVHCHCPQCVESAAVPSG